MRLSDWFWGSIPETFWTVTDDGQRIVSDAGLHEFFDNYGNYSIVEENDPSAADGAIIDNSEDEKPVDAEEKQSEPEGNTPAPDKPDRTDEVVSKLDALTTTMTKVADRLTKLVVAIDAKGNAEVDDDEVEVW
jgi:hypothetical protein|nr:MAG TPA: hypothetical protein [Caudoviricetes sp.]